MATKHSTCESGYTITITKGYTLNLPWSYQNPDGTGIDLTGKSIEFQLVFEDVTYTYTETINSYGSGVTITDVTDGEYTVKITDDETSTFEVASGKWVVVLVNGGDREILYSDIVEIVEL